MTTRSVRQLRDRMREQQRAVSAGVSPAVRTTDRSGGSIAPTRVGVIRFVDLTNNIAYAQEVAYTDTTTPVEGEVSAVGGWVRVYPLPGHLYAPMVPFVVPQFTQSGATITSPAAFDAATDPNTTDALLAQTLGVDNLIPVMILSNAGVDVVSIPIKMPATLGSVDPSILLSGGSSA